MGGEKSKFHVTIYTVNKERYTEVDSSKQILAFDEISFRNVFNNVRREVLLKGNRPARNLFFKVERQLCKREKKGKQHKEIEGLM